MRARINVMKKEEILKLVREYAKENLSNKDVKPFKAGDRIPYSAKVFDEEEVVNLVDSALEFWLTQGHYYGFRSRCRYRA